MTNKKLFVELVKNLTSTIKETGYFVPIVFLVGPKTKNALPLTDEVLEHKSIFLRYLGAKLRTAKENIEYILFIAEGWAATDPKVKPSEAIAKKEVVVFFAMGIDGTADFVIKDIIRDSAGNITDLVDRDLAGAEGYSYLLSEFWDAYKGIEWTNNSIN